MNKSEKNQKAREEEQMKNQKKTKALRWSRRFPAILNPMRRLLEPPQRLIEPYVTKGQVVADLGCGSGYYTFALAQRVGSEGRVYAVDLDETGIHAIEKKMEKEGYHTIEAHVSSASDVGFIKDKSVDFVLANGLLCSMADRRQEAVNEIKRILKPGGKAYLSLGALPPLGFTNRAEWKNLLEGFTVEQGGGSHLWAVVKT